MPATSTRSIPQIPGLQLLDEVGQGAHTVVYRAIHDRQTVAIKVQRPDDSLDERAFRREAAVLARLDHPGLARILDIGEVGGRAYLVMEYVEGANLSSLVEAGPLPEYQLLSLATDLAEALGEVHRKGLVHRDVKPRNVMVASSGRARLIDFGLAARSTELRPDGAIAGSFLYSAPEQTGMLTRPVDGRSDLYALGALLYEAGTGRPPFTGRDVGELIRRHALDTPVPLRALNPELSEGLEAIVHKLLAKDPDDRYQTGAGLVHDLVRVSSLSRLPEAERAATLGQGDHPQEVEDLPLVGREEELATAREAWLRARRGQGGVLVIHGEAGTGKSRLGREILRWAQQEGQFVLPISCSEQDPVPYAPLREALDDLAARTQRLGEPRRQEAVHDLHRALRRASPQVALLSAPLCRLLELSTEEATDSQGAEAFQRSVAAFLVGLARQHQAMLLWVDGAQWLDEASTRVLGQLTRELEEVGLLLLITTRTPPGQPLAGLGLESAQDHVVLGPLSEAEIRELVGHHLGGVHVQDFLLGHISRRAVGNPFAAGEYLRAMLESGLVRPAWGTWTLDPKGLEALELPDDVLALVVRRVDALGEAAVRVLRAAAVMGTQFDLELLGQVWEGEPGSVEAAVGEAMRTRLVEHVAWTRYAFVHAAAQEALLQAASDEQIRDLHWRMATVLHSRERTTAADTYALAHHAARGHVQRDPRLVYEASLVAGMLARSEFAAERAWELLVQAREVAEAHHLEPDQVLVQALGQTAAHVGQLDEATAHLEEALEHAVMPVDRARLHAALADLHLWGWVHTARVRQELDAAFRVLGVPAPRGPLGQLLSTAWYGLRGLLARALGSAEARGDQAERLDVLSTLYTLATGVAYFDMELLPLLETAARQFHASALVPPSKAKVDDYLALSLVAAGAGASGLARAWADEAVRIAEEVRDEWALAGAVLYRGFTQHQSGESQQAELTVQTALQSHGRWLETVDYLLGCSDITWNLLMRGRAAEAHRWITVARERTATADPSNPVHGHAVFLYEPVVEAVLGRPSEARAALERVRAALEPHPHIRYWHAELAVHEVGFHLEQGEWGEAMDEALERLDARQLSPRLAAFHLKAGFVFAVHARAAQAMVAPEHRRAERLAQLQRALKRLRPAADLAVFATHLHLGRAWLAQLQGQPRQAHDQLDLAARLAQDMDNTWVLFEVWRTRATLYADEGNASAARRSASHAFRLAAAGGWGPRLRRLRQLDQHGSSRSLSSSVSASSLETHPDRLRMDRHLGALLQVSLASATARSPQHQTQLALDALVKVLGAERAMLFSSEDGGATLGFLRGRDATGQDVPASAQHGSTLVERVRATREPLVVSGTDQGEILGSESSVAQGLRSILAAPMLLKDRLMGVVYLDTRLARGMFTEDDVDILTAIANQIAASLEQARLQAEIHAEEARRQALERFHAPDVVRRLIMHHDSPSWRSRDGRFLESVEATILFCDLSEFTSFSDAHAPEEVARLLNTYLGRMTEIAFAYRGTVDKYIGDSVMCIFGAPFPAEDDALRAVHCALDMRKAVERMALSLEAGPDTGDLQVHIGINTGPVVAGTVGSAKRMEYTALGDAVNTASRLQSFASAGQIVVGARTAELVGEEVELRPLGEVELKGKARAVEAWEVEDVLFVEDLTSELVEERG